MSTATEIAERRAKILPFIEEYRRKNGRQPSEFEVMDRLNLIGVVSRDLVQAELYRLPQLDRQEPVMCRDCLKLLSWLEGFAEHQLDPSEHQQGKADMARLVAAKLRELMVG